jgi:hypothetical protein
MTAGPSTDRVCARLSCWHPRSRHRNFAPRVQAQHPCADCGCPEFLDPELALESPR